MNLVNNNRIYLENLDVECCAKLKEEYTFTTANPPRHDFYGVVFEGRRRKDNKKVAIKCIEICAISRWYELTDGKVKWPLEAYILHILKPVSGVIDLLDHFQGSRNTYVLILERLERAVDLSDFLLKQKYFYLSERRARTIFIRVLIAVLDMMDCNVVHMNITKENIIIDMETSDIKLIGFRCASIIPRKPRSIISDVDGGIQYPEIAAFNQCYPNTATVWSLGVLLYNLVHDHDLYFKDPMDLVFGETNHRISTSLSSELRDLIKKCLIKHPNDRIGLRQILKHPWIEQVKKATP